MTQFKHRKDIFVILSRRLKGEKEGYIKGYIMDIFGYIKGPSERKCKPQLNERHLGERPHGFSDRWDILLNSFAKSLSRISRNKIF